MYSPLNCFESSVVTWKIKILADLVENALLVVPTLGFQSLFLPNASSGFDEIWSKVAEYGFPSFATNGYTWKNLDHKIINLIP